MHDAKKLTIGNFTSDAIETTHNSQHQSEDWRINKVISLPTNQPEYQWQVPELAETVKLSARQLQRLFKIEMQCSLWQYLRQLRLKKAGELLRTTDDNVMQIAANVGMNDYSHFVRDFQKSYRVTPGEYRKAQFKFAQKTL